MSRTDQERFRQILRKSGLEKICFPQPDNKYETYFEDMESQTRLAVYNPENVHDVRRDMNGIMTEENFEQVKEECIKMVVKSLISWEGGSQEEKRALGADIKIPAFIYNF